MLARWRSVTGMVIAWLAEMCCAWKAVVGMANWFDRLFGRRDRRSVAPTQDDDESLALPTGLRALIEALEAWIDTPDWNSSRAYLKSHADALLTDEAEAVLAMLAQAQQADGARRIIADHQRLLRAARAQNDIDAAYDALLRDRPAAT